MILLSIIIPVYNGGIFVRRCLESISASIKEAGIDLDLVEIIVVDDGSIDNSLLILNNLRDKYNIKIYSKENGGVSSARNYGLKNASGKYIQFVDVDDRVVINCYKDLLPSLKEDQDLILFGYVTNGDCKKKYLYEGSSFNFLEMYLKGRICINLWSCVFCMDVLINCDIQFDESTFYGEDREFLVKSLVQSRVQKYIKRSLYEYNVCNECSAMNAEFSVKRLTSIDTDLRIFNYVKLTSKCKQIEDAALNQVLANYYSTKRKIRKMGGSQIFESLKKYSYLENIIPPFQFTKFWMFNVFSKVFN